MYKPVCAVILTVGVIASAAHADTIYVDDDNCPGPGSGTEGDPFCSIQDAIDAATGEVVVAPGTYFEVIDFHGKGVTVRSTDGPEVTIINGSGFQWSVVTCTSFEGPQTVLQGFTITGGNAPQTLGGGWYNQNSSPTVIDCIFFNNRESNGAGGGMLNSQSSPTLIDCTFSENDANAVGAMFTFVNGFPTVINCTFSGNTAAGSTNGGGIQNQQGAYPVVSGSVFCENVPTHI